MSKRAGREVPCVFHFSQNGQHHILGGLKNSTAEVPYLTSTFFINPVEEWHSTFKVTVKTCTGTIKTSKDAVGTDQETISSSTRDSQIIEIRAYGSFKPTCYVMPKTKAEDSDNDYFEVAFDAAIQQMRPDEQVTFNRLRENGNLLALQFDVPRQAILIRSGVANPQLVAAEHRLVRYTLSEVFKHPDISGDELLPMIFFFVSHPAFSTAPTIDEQAKDHPLLDDLHQRFMHEFVNHPYEPYFEKKAFAFRMQRNHLKPFAACPELKKRELRTTYFDHKEFVMYEGAALLREAQLEHAKNKEIEDLPVPCAFVKPAQSNDELYIAILRVPQGFPVQIPARQSFKLRISDTSSSAWWTAKLSSLVLPQALTTGTVVVVSRPRNPDGERGENGELPLDMICGPPVESIFDMKELSQNTGDIPLRDFCVKDFVCEVFLKVDEHDATLKAQVRAPTRLNPVDDLTNDPDKRVAAMYRAHKLGHSVNEGPRVNVLGIHQDGIDQKLADLAIAPINPSQRAALEYLTDVPNGRAYIIGFPGSGKTHLCTMISAMANSINHQVAVVAPTNTIADNFAQKMHRMMEQRGLQGKVIRLHARETEVEKLHKPGSVALPTTADLASEFIVHALLKQIVTCTRHRPHRVRDDRFQLAHLSLANRILEYTSCDQLVPADVLHNDFGGTVPNVQAESHVEGNDEDDGDEDDGDEDDGDEDDGDEDDGDEDDGDEDDGDEDDGDDDGDDNCTLRFTTEEATFHFNQLYRIVLVGGQLDQEQKKNFKGAIKRLKHDVIYEAAVLVMTIVAVDDAVVQGATQNYRLIIIEEAGKVNPPTMNIVHTAFPGVPLICAGDPMQSGPHEADDMKNPWAAQLSESELGIKIFLGVEHAILRHQYRMEPGISNWISDLIYDKTFRKHADTNEKHVMVAQVDVAQRPNIERMRDFFQAVGLGRVNFGALRIRGQSYRTGATMSKQNQQEVQACLAIIRKLEARGVNPVDMTVIVGYSAQVAALRQALAQSEPKFTNVRCMTIDAIHGDENSIIIMSFVGTDSVGFLSNRRRMIVALTRARDGLIILGDFKSLRLAERRRATFIQTALRKLEKLNAFKIDLKVDVALLK